MDILLNQNPQNQPNPEQLGKLAEAKGKQEEVAIKKQGHDLKAAETVLQAKQEDKRMAIEFHDKAAEREIRKTEVAKDIIEERLRLAQKQIGVKNDRRD